MYIYKYIYLLIISFTNSIAIFCCMQKKQRTKGEIIIFVVYQIIIII